MNKIQQVKLKSAQETAVHYAGATALSALFVILYVITGPLAADRVVKKAKKRYADNGKELTKSQELKTGLCAFFSNWYLVPKNAFALAKEDANKSRQARMNEYNQYLAQTGVADLLQIIDNNNIEFHDVKFVKPDGEVVLKQCYCVGNLAIYIDKKNKRCGVFDCLYRNNAIPADDYLNIPTDLVADVCNALTARVVKQDRQVQLALEQETKVNRERIAAEKLRKRNEHEAAFKAMIAARAKSTTK